MKRTWPPPQVILVGLELNQHGHAASHEQASSSWPVIFHGVLSFGSFAARTGAAWTRKLAMSAQEKSDLVFIQQNFMATWPRCHVEPSETSLAIAFPVGLAK